MPTADRVVHTEKTPWPGWVAWLVWVPLLVSMVLVALGVDGGSPTERAVAMATLVGVGAFVLWAMTGITVRLYPDRLVVGMGDARVFRSVVPYDRIEAVRAARYSPLKDFGGWGYRMKSGARAWTARGDGAVVLTVADGPELWIGTDHPERLRERIASMGGIARSESG